jgi:hypothetical protein
LFTTCIIVSKPSLHEIRREEDDVDVSPRFVGVECPRDQLGIWHIHRQWLAQRRREVKGTSQSDRENFYGSPNIEHPTSKPLHK